MVDVKVRELFQVTPPEYIVQVVEEDNDTYRVETNQRVVLVILSLREEK